MKKIVEIINTTRYKVISLSILFVAFLTFFITNSFAVLTPISSITVSSKTLSYSDEEEGSWQFTKTAKWMSKGKAKINIKLNTLEKKQNDYTDVILVLDTSGSMVGEKLTQVQNDVNELINDTVPKGNKISLITFNDTAIVVNGFTDDTNLLQDNINNLTVTGETNYYQALVKVDEVLSTYEKLDNKNCVVLFLTDGLPTIDTPLEIGEYKYLKNKYDYLEISGIQYELGNDVLDEIKNITDIQYLANKDNLNNFLYKASISLVSYDNFVLTDYVDTNNFNLKDISTISTTFGTASIKNNQIIWNLDNFKAGLNAELIVDVNLNNDLIGKSGMYSTNIKTDISYKIDSIDTTESTTKTTVLKDNYAVNYLANAPSDCIVSNMPSQKNYFVFDTVKISDKVPVCEGYQFQEWKIVNTNVDEKGKNQFIMPEKDVILKAIWKKLNVKKSMDGRMSKAQTLYSIVADESKGLDTDIDFGSNSNDTDSGIYTIDGTENDKYPVHYYRGNVDNNNVIFAGFCWKIVRTTSTGGVKLVYNGIPKDDYDSSIPIGKDEYIDVSNDSTYPYSYDSLTNKWTSAHETSTISLSVSKSGTYKLSYSISSKISYNHAYFYKDGKIIAIDSGINSDSISLGDLTPSNVIMIKYKKNIRESFGTDSVTFSIDKVSGNAVKSCNNTYENTQIGTGKFNSDSSSPANVGYMYGTRYTYDKKIFPKVNVLNQHYASPRSSYYYGTAVTYSDGVYTLQNAEQKLGSDNYDELIGYYTCQSTSTTCSTVYYIVGVNTWQYSLPLTSGVTDPNTQTMTLGKGSIDNGNGTYSLTDVVTIKKIDWYANYSTYENYYVCKDFASTTCDNKYIISFTSITGLFYDNTYKYIYGNDVIWDGEKYTLIDTYTSMLGINNDTTTLAKKYHYTCFNTTGECKDVYYIHTFPSISTTIQYIVLTSGKKIEEANEEMFMNTNDSIIKQVIDDWYKNNMTSYTERLEDTVWCNDRTFAFGSLMGKDEDAGASPTGYSYFSAYNRNLIKYSPDLTCPNQSRDGFTVSTSSGGNGALTYPVGLLTADEVLLAGGKKYFNNSNYYLYTGQSYWLLSPAAFFVSGSTLFRSADSLNVDYTSINYGIRPSVSLSQGIRIVEGDGTINYPYIIE